MIHQQHSTSSLRKQGFDFTFVSEFKIVHTKMEANKSYNAQSMELQLRSEITLLKEKLKKLEDKNRILEMGSQSHVIQLSMEKLQIALKPRFFRMNDLILNEGLKHLALKILNMLDRNDLKNCQLVSKSWRELILNDKFWWQLQVSQINIFPVYKPSYEDRTYRRLVEEYPEFIEIFEFLLSKKATLEDLKTYETFMKALYVYQPSSSFKCPLHFAVVDYEEGIEVLKLFMKTSIDMNIPEDLDGHTPLQQACYFGKTDIEECGMGFHLGEWVLPVAEWMQEVAMWHLNLSERILE